MFQQRIISHTPSATRPTTHKESTEVHVHEAGGCVHFVWRRMGGVKSQATLYSYYSNVTRKKRAPSELHSTIVLYSYNLYKIDVKPHFERTARE